MAKPGWQWIRVDVLLPEHPKLRGLTSAQCWLIVQLWLSSGRHLSDGFIPECDWQTFGRADSRARLVAAGWFDPVPGGYQAHDWADHQRTRAEVQAVTEQRSNAAQARWAKHAARNANRTTARIGDTMRPAPPAHAARNAGRYADKNREESPLPPAGQATRLHHLSDPALDTIITTIRTHHGQTISMAQAREIAANLAANMPTGPLDTLAYLRTELLTANPAEYHHPNGQPPTQERTE